MPVHNITITPRQDKFVETALESGRYKDVDEIFRTGLRLLERFELNMQLREKTFHQELDKGRESYEQGDCIKFTSPEELHTWFEDRRKRLLDELDKSK